MAKRLYLPSAGAVGVSPAFDASWEATGSAVRRPLEPHKDDSALTAFGVATALNSPAGAVDVLIAQYVSAPLSGAQTINGAIKGQIRALENNASGDLRSQCVIRVVSNDGTTVRGTLVASSAAALASEWPTSIANRKMPLGSPVTPSSVNAQDGDRIVVEIGYRKHENGTTSRTGTLNLGSPATGTDLPEDETTTTAGVPWIEFANTLVFQAIAARESQVVVVAAGNPTNPTIRESQEVVVVAGNPTNPTIRESQVVVVVAYTPSRNADLGLDWSIRNTRTTDLGLDAILQVARHADLGLDWIIRAPRYIELGLDYAISTVDSTTVGSDLEIDYSIAPTAVGSNFTFAARVSKATKLQQRGASLGLKYRILTKAVAGQDLGISWIVEPPLAVAGTNLEINAEVQVNTIVGVDLDLDSVVTLPTPRSDFTFDAVVEQETPFVDLTFDAAISTTVGSDLSVDATLDTAVHADLEFDAIVRAPARGDLVIDAIVQATVGSELSLDAAITTAVGSELDFDATIRSLADADLDIDAVVRAPARADLGLDATVQTSVDSDLAIDYEIEESSGVARADLALDYAIEANEAERTSAGGGTLVIKRLPREVRQVHADLTIDAPIASTVGRSLLVDAAIATTKSAHLELDAPIARSVGWDLMIDAERLDFYDQNRAVLLAEIDPDLIGT